MGKKQLHISVPTPCMEDWNNMTPDKNGKFCASCQKTVVDFSRMSDTEIIHYFDNFKGATCGRFTEKQLSAPITEQSMSKPQNRWAWALSALLLPTIAASQTVKTTELSAVTTPSVFEKKSAIDADFLKIEGEVRELGDKFLPIDGAIVAVNINDKIVAYAQTDSFGIFTINLLKLYENQRFTLNVSQIGFEKQALPFEHFAAIKGNRLFISLENTPIDITDAVVCTGYGVAGKVGVVVGQMEGVLTGGVVFHRPNVFQRIKNRIQKFFRLIRSN